MKRLFSVLLALAMVLTIAPVALAVPPPISGFSAGGITRPRVDEDGRLFYICRPKGATCINDDYLLSDVAHSGRGHTAEYGSIVFLELLHAEEVWENFSLDMIRGMKVKASWEQGGNLVESVSVEIVRGYSYILEGEGWQFDYFPALVIRLKDSAGTDAADIIGTVTLNKSGGKAEYRIKDAKIPVEFEVDYWHNNSRYTPIGIDDVQFIFPGEQYLLRFDCDEQVELFFGKAPNEGSFTVDVSGQGKLLLIFDTMPNKAVEKANPLAKLVFFGFNGVRFNRAGEYFYETETGRYIYELINGIPTPISGAVYDEQEGGFRFYTATLGRYVISDIELNMPDSDEAGDEAIRGDDLHNPTMLERELMV